VHERVEKALLDDFQTTYQHAHQLAVRSEQQACLADGIDWHVYNDTFDAMAAANTGAPKRVHPELDMTPYLSYDDADSLKLVLQMRKAMKSR
jgi:hypothetical protein